MQKYTSTLERHTKFMKFGLETRLRSKVLKAIGNLQVFSELKSKQQFLSKCILNRLYLTQLGYQGLVTRQIDANFVRVLKCEWQFFFIIVNKFLRMHKIIFISLLISNFKKNATRISELAQNWHRFVWLPTLENLTVSNTVYFICIYLRIEGDIFQIIDLS